nr:MAG TPA: hypothetical protein [Caudoviricetes sp.]
MFLVNVFSIYNIYSLLKTFRVGYLIIILNVSKMLL